MTASTFNALAAARLATGPIPRPRRRLYAALRAGHAPGVHAPIGALRTAPSRARIVRADKAGAVSPR